MYDITVPLLFLKQRMAKRENLHYPTQRTGSFYYFRFL